MHACVCGRCSHYLLLQRMLLLFKRMLDCDALASPRRGLLAASQQPLSPSAGVSSTTSVSLQRLSLLFSSVFLSPLYPSATTHAALDSALRKAQEQQVLVF